MTTKFTKSLRYLSVPSSLGSAGWAANGLVMWAWCAESSSAWKRNVNGPQQPERPSFGVLELCGRKLEYLTIEQSFWLCLGILALRPEYNINLPFLENIHKPLHSNLQYCIALLSPQPHFKKRNVLKSLKLTHTLVCWERLGERCMD